MSHLTGKRQVKVGFGLKKKTKTLFYVLLFTHLALLLHMEWEDEYDKSLIG